MLLNLLIIGAQKSGTASLHDYLNCHLDISMSEKKEVGFFAQHWEKGLGCYASDAEGGLRRDDPHIAIYWAILSPSLIPAQNLSLPTFTERAL